jgi:glycerol-3-phosphate dehydrogenase
MKVYDMLARRYRFGPSRILSKRETLAVIPTLKTDGLRGGVQYYDGQFDDARLLINLVQTAAEQGAAVLNYVRVVDLIKDDDGYVTGVVGRDAETGQEGSARARCVINATGPFADAVRRMDDPGAEPMIAPSQGVHVVLDRSFLPGDTAIMVPHTPDDRVMFAIPWHGHVVVGTTDTPIGEISLEPIPFPEEIDFVLETASQYLAKPPSKDDVLSTFAGIRPLVRAGVAENTAALSRDHTIHVARSGLVTIAGGKWTTYRRMAEDCVDQAAVIAGLDDKPCQTRRLNVHGYHRHADKFGELAFYGSDAPAIEDLMRTDPSLAEPLHPDLPIRAGQVVWAARRELARTVDDVLARRTRALPLNAWAAVEMAPRVASLLAAELDRDDTWAGEQVAAFGKLARSYRPTTARPTG